MEQRAAIKFCFKLGKTATETFKMIEEAYKDESLSRKNVFKWFAMFKDGRESIEDAERPGGPKTSRIEENIQKVADILKNDRCVSLKLIEEMTDIPRTTVHRILVDDLGKRKVCARFVPHSLTEDQKAARVEHCADMKTSADNDPTFLQNIITADETWCFQYEPKTKRQSAEWIGSDESKPKKLRYQKSKVKTMLIVFFDSKGIVHKEFIPSGQTVNGQYYLTILDRLWKRVHRIRPEYRQPGSWSLLHDNAPAHKCVAVRKFLCDKQITVVDHPPYSPDLAPCDFYLFPKLKIFLKGSHFDSIEEIQSSVTSYFNSLKREDFQACFRQFYNRFSLCITSEGEYFE